MRPKLPRFRVRTRSCVAIALVAIGLLGGGGDLVFQADDSACPADPVEDDGDLTTISRGGVVEVANYALRTAIR